MPLLHPGHCKWATTSVRSRLSELSAQRALRSRVVNLRQLMRSGLSASQLRGCESNSMMAARRPVDWTFPEWAYDDVASRLPAVADHAPVPVHIEV
jgi:hypothetical protein